MRFFVFYAPEGAGGEAALATPATSGGQQQAAQASQQPAGTQQAPVAQAQEESFESLIEGKYKQDFQKRVQGIVRDRLKGQKQQLDRLTPVLDTLGQLYGVDMSDLSKADFDALQKKLAGDKRFYEAEALEKGIPVETAMELQQARLQNAQLLRSNEQMRQEEARRQEFEQLVGQFETVRQRYPGADLSAELQNPAFGRLVANGVPAMTAYEVLHKDEIDRAKLQAVAQAAQQQVVSTVQANGARPQEAAANAGAGVALDQDPSKWTREQRAEIKKRVMRGDRIQL